jgi:kynurenine formamidase
MPLQSTTQWDSLAHVYYDGRLYNGFTAGEVDSRGAQKDGIDKTHDRYVSRGVLLDVARAHGVDCLDPGDDITGGVLEATAAAEGVAIEEGDIIVLRAGVMADWVSTGSWAGYRGPRAGVVYSTAEWLHDHRVAAIAGDTVEKVEVIESGALESPFHMLALRDMGMCIGELWFVEDLAEDCASDGVYEMFLAAQALPVTGGVGSPVNPIAIK